MSLRHDDRFTQQHGFLHAGVVASVMDTACGFAAFSVMPPDAADSDARPFAVMQATMTAVTGRPGLSG